VSLFLLYFSQIISLHTRTHTAPSAPGAPVGAGTGAPEGKTGDSDTDSGKGNVNAVPDKIKTLTGQDASNTDNGSDEIKGSNIQIVPGQMPRLSPCLYLSLSLFPKFLFLFMHLCSTWARIVRFVFYISRPAILELRVWKFRTIPSYHRSPRHIAICTSSIVGTFCDRIILCILKLMRFSDLVNALSPSFVVFL